MGRGGGRRLLVLGTDARARALADRLRNDGTEIVGHVHLDAGAPQEGGPGRVFALSELADLLREDAADEVIAASAECTAALEICTAAGAPLTLVAEFPGEGAPTRVAAHRRRPSPAPGGLAVKRGIDVAVASLGLLLAAPILGLCAVAIQLGSPGAVLSRETRCGLHGRRFTLYRLRTAETGSGRWRGDRGPRGAVGGFVHAAGLDEVPVLWNVLRGDMSLVGPRPPRPAEMARGTDTMRRRLTMRPGLTCTWQLRGRTPLADDECAKLDLQYIDGWTVGRDLEILAGTLPAVLRDGDD